MGTTSSAALPDWRLPVFQLVPLPTLAVGALLGVGYLALFGVFVTLAGMGAEVRPSGAPWSNSILWDNVVSALLIAYLPMATVWGLQGTLRDLSELRPALRCSEAEFQEHLRRTLEFDPRRRRLVSLLAIPLILAPIVAVFQWTGGLFGRPSLPLGLWSAGRVLLLAWLALQLATFDIAMIRGLRRLAREHVHIDLLDLRVLEPFSRHGLRTALIWIVGFGVFSLFGLTQTSGAGDATGLVMMLGFGAASLVLPVLPLRRRIRARKRAELERIGAALRRARDSGGDDDDAGALADRVANLLAYERRVEEVREWPFAAFTLTRFALYASLGAGSWLGAALVERALDTFLR